MECEDLISFKDNVIENYVDIKCDTAAFPSNTRKIDCSERESLGILHWNTLNQANTSFLNSSNTNSIFETPLVDLGRESLSYCPNSDLLCCSAVDIPNISFELLNDSVFDHANNSFRLSSCFNNFDSGKQSLGILHPDYFRCSLSDADNFLLLQSSQEVRSSLNTAFLETDYKSDGISLTSNASSFNLNACSFNSQSLASVEPSPIYSLSINTTSNLNSVLNDAILNSYDFQLKLASSDVSTNLNEPKIFRPKIQSLPVILEHEIDKCSDGDGIKKISCWSDNGIKQKCDLSVLCKGEEEEFNDSVFIIEAQHIASKIADGSILETPFGEINIETTSQPQWVEFLESDATDHAENKTEIIFKTVDKIIPVNMKSDIRVVDNVKSYTKLNVSIEKTPEISNDGANSSMKHTSCNSTGSLGCDEFQNFSGVLNCCNKRLSASQISQSSNKSKSRDAKEILHNLSEILMTENRSSEQKIQGQNLLVSLCDILHASKSDGCSEDSGHSSFEILDQDEKNCELTSSEINADRRLSRSFSCLNANTASYSQDPKLFVNKNSFPARSRSMSVCALDKKINCAISRSPKKIQSSTSSRNLSKLPASGTFKPKKTTAKASLKMGPMRAVIPVGSMSKSKKQNEALKVNVTPKLQSSYKRKHTSTAIADLKPVAQSTPDGTNANSEQLKPQHPNNKFDCSVSPLTRKQHSVSDISNNSSINKSNKSGSASNLSQEFKRSEIRPNTSVSLRRSASDLRPPQKSVYLKRSNSIGKDIAVSGPAVKVQANLLTDNNSRLLTNKTDSKIAMYKSRTLSTEKNLNKSGSYIRPFNLMSKLRKSDGKENAGH